MIRDLNNYPKDSEENPSSLVIPTDRSFFTPKYSVWFQILTIPGAEKYSFIPYEKALERINDMKIPWVGLSEIRQNILRGSMSEIKPPFIPYVTKDVIDVRRVMFNTDVQFSSSINVIEMIIGDKEVDRFQITSNYKQNMAIFTQGLDYDYFPPVYVFDTFLVHVRFFDILCLSCFW